MEDGYGFPALIEAMQIFKEYSDEKWVLGCEHDVLRVYVSPQKVDDKEQKRLEELGFTPDERFDCFKSFRHGSA